MLHVRTVRRSAAGVASEQTYFAYDALGRRIAKRNSGNVTRFVWDGMRLLQERRKGLAGTYVYEENGGNETYTPLARLDTPCSLDKAFGKISLSENTPKSQFYYYHVNTSGQPEELTDADGKVVWQARYATWGRVLEERSAPGIEQNLRFQGQYFDQETGLCYNTFRYYDPDLGRFITEDPIGLDGGINLYQYGPNPLMWIDPWGWKCKSQFNGERGIKKAKYDFERNGFEIISKEVTIKINGSRVRADIIAKDRKGMTHVFEVKHGSGRLTKAQKAAGVYKMKNPSNTAPGGGGIIKPSQGTQGTFTVDTHGSPGQKLGGYGAQNTAMFHVLKYE